MGQKSVYMLCLNSKMNQRWQEGTKHIKIKKNNTVNYSTCNEFWRNKKSTYMTGEDSENYFSGTKKDYDIF